MVDPELRASAVDLPETPGVYRFLDGVGRVLYVGKAKNLKKRVASYFSGELSAKTAAMVARARKLSVTVAPDENQALLMEAALIKALKPRYNLLLRDDKSYPYIHLDTSAPFPRIARFRGETKGKKGLFFGPYPSGRAVRETLKWMQRIIPLRQCADSRFSTRQRPCLEYQIKRCGGPCSGRVDEETYGGWVRQATLFLRGRARELAKDLEKEMWAAAEGHDFEEAARLRDRLRAIDHVMERQKTALSGAGNLDVVALAADGGRAVVQLLFVREGLILGGRELFPENGAELSTGVMLQSVLEQLYADKEPPPEILVNAPVEEAAWIEAALGEKRGGRVRIARPLRGSRKTLVDTAVREAEESLQRLLAGQDAVVAGLEGLVHLLGLAAVPVRVEAYDISHTADEAPVASRVVLTGEGFARHLFRHFNIHGHEASDDTARMAQVIDRRFSRDGAESGDEWPDVVLLDGGRGQLNAALSAFGARGGVSFCALAKGVSRGPETERLFLPDRDEPFILPEHSAAALLLRRMRDEAHRFAVGHHRGRRKTARKGSLLDDIPGVGPVRRRALLNHFGSVRAVRAAGVEALQEAGIPEGVALRIVAYLASS